MELLDQQGLGGFGTEVAQENHQSVDAVLTDIRQSLGYVRLVLNGDGALVQAFAESLHDVLTALGGQRNGEAVTGYGNNAKLNFRNIHGAFLLLL